MKPLLEIAVFNIESARIAMLAGADRLELCIDLAAGGLTPPAKMIGQAKEEHLSPFFVMIRPKGGDFVYTDAEFSKMKEELLMAKSAGADGFVFGILNVDGTVNEKANKELVTLADTLPCTFHRAFDDITDKQTALEQLISCGFERVLTSGGAGNAADYGNELKQLVSQANGRIIVMPGGGVRSNNLQQIKELTGATEYHSAAIINGGTIADADAIKSMLKILSKY